MIVAVCDSNVYVSAIVFGGIPRDVVMLGEHKQIQLLVSPGLISEVERGARKQVRMGAAPCAADLPAPLALGSAPPLSFPTQIRAVTVAETWEDRVG